MGKMVGYVRGFVADVRKAARDIQRCRHCERPFSSPGCLGLEGDRHGGPK